MRDLVTTFLAATFVATFITAAAAQDAAAPPLVEQINGGNWLPQDEAEELRDELFYQRAIHAYMTMQPALNVIGMRDGSEAAFGAGYNVLPIWKDRMDSRTWVPTPNADVVYSMSYLDLKETGPLVVHAPPNVIGMFTDFFQRTITDVGAIGPDRARGGLYLLLPPGYEGHVPDGYFTFKSSTYNVFLFFRHGDGAGRGRPGPGTGRGAGRADAGLSAVGGGEGHPADGVSQRQRPAGEHDVPVDNSYWSKLKAFVDYEPVTAIDPELRGVLASIGIVKGQPFAPTEREQELLQRAVETAPKMILALRQLGRPDGRNLYYDDRQWERAWAGGTAEWMQESYLDVNQRAAFFQYAYSSAPAMVMRTTGAGSKYPFTARDARRRFPERVQQLPAASAAEPARRAVLGGHRLQRDRRHHARDAAAPALDQRLRRHRDQPGRLDRPLLRAREAGRRPGVNWIQTVDGRNFLVALRLYGAGVEFYDQSWKPDDIVRLD